MSAATHYLNGFFFFFSMILRMAIFRAISEAILRAFVRMKS
jgi:hypothetical protein